MSYLIDIILDDSALPEPTPEIAQERRVAIFDLLQENEFILIREGAPKGPYKLQLGMQDRRLVFTVTTENDEPRWTVYPLTITFKTSYKRLLCYL